MLHSALSDCDAPLTYISSSLAGAGAVNALLHVRKTTCHNTERNRTSLDMSSPRNNQADFSGICFSDATEPFTSKCCCVLLELNVSSSLVSRLQGSGRISVKQCFHNVCKCLFTEPRGRSNPPEIMASKHSLLLYLLYPRSL